MRHFVVISLFLFLFCQTEAAVVYDPKRPKEYAIKSRIFRLVLDYVHWPAHSGLPNRKMVIGIPGTHPMRTEMDQAFASPKDQSSKTIVYITSLSKLSECDVLFIGKAELDQLNEILQQTKGRPVLIIGDSPGFAKRGAMINMALEQETVKLEVNLTTTRSAGLEIDSTLLRNARIVE